MLISEYNCAMARAATTSDVFNAIAEPQRREILVLLRAGERPVTEVARELRMTQPGPPQHLRGVHGGAAPVAVVGTGGVHHHHAGVRAPRRRGVGLRDARTGRDGLPGVDLLDRDRPAGADRAAPR